MTCAILKDFGEKIHRDLCATRRGKGFVVKESDLRSEIKEIEILFSKNDIVVVIQQRDNACEAIQKLFEKRIPQSCDFIVLFCKKADLYIYFCEIKSLDTLENRSKTMKQIEGSQIFLDFLFKNYNHCFDNKELSLECAYIKKIMIASKPMAQKGSVTIADDKNNNTQLITKEIRVDKDGFAKIENWHDFLNFQ